MPEFFFSKRRRPGWVDCLIFFCVALACFGCEDAANDVYTRPESLPLHPSHKTGSLSLECPSGAALQGELPPKNLEQFCVKALPDGTKQQHGPYRSWYNSQIKESEGEYRDGLKQGVWYFWHANGMPSKKGFYASGRRQGEWVLYVPEMDTYRHLFVTYRDDVETGPWRSMHLAPPGARPQFTDEEGGVENGKRHGLWKTYYPTGHRYGEGEYVSGQLQGPAKYWHESGAAKEAGEYRRDLREGEWTEWEEQGKRYRKGVYVGGVKDGVWREYDETGQPVESVTYKNGEVVATEMLAVARGPTSTPTGKAAEAEMPQAASLPETK